MSQSIALFALLAWQSSTPTRCLRPEDSAGLLSNSADYSTEERHSKSKIDPMSRLSEIASASKHIEVASASVLRTLPASGGSASRNSSFITVSTQGLITSLRGKYQKELTIEAEWLKFLLYVIGTDDGKTISKEGWKDKVKGPWEEPMWQSRFRVEGEVAPELDKKEWNQETWNAAAADAFYKMGGLTNGSDGDLPRRKEISKEDMEKWNLEGCSDWQIKFAEDVAGSDKRMDLCEFEEFLYTMVLFMGIDVDTDGTIRWKEFSGEGLDPPRKVDVPKQFGWSNQDFQNLFGPSGLQIKGVYDYLKQHKGIFTCVAEANPEPEGWYESGSVRVVLTYAVIALIATHWLCRTTV